MKRILLALFVGSAIAHAACDATASALIESQRQACLSGDTQASGGLPPIVVPPVIASFDPFAVAIAAKISDIQKKECDDSAQTALLSCSQWSDQAALEQAAEVDTLSIQQWEASKLRSCPDCATNISGAASGYAADPNTPSE